ncbi:unnamed protein product [marine sediment metagenome]|uniref:Uncharacterized protein n=1 Tax=marine sediment metagenome TaxID=412755 RepID=X0YHA6_9ZZZZ
MKLTKREIQVMIMCIDISFSSDIKEALWNRFDVTMTKTEIHQMQLDIDDKLRHELDS